MNGSNFTILAYVIGLGLIAVYAVTLGLELRVALRRDRKRNGGGL